LNERAPMRACVIYVEYKNHNTLFSDLIRSTPRLSVVQYIFLTIAPQREGEKYICSDYNLSRKPHDHFFSHSQRVGTNKTSYYQYGAITIFSQKTHVLDKMILHYKIISLVSVTKKLLLLHFFSIWYSW